MTCTYRAPNTPFVPQILKIVQKLEREESMARERQKEEEEKSGREAAERLVIEMNDQVHAMVMQKKEQDEHALYVAEKKSTEERDRDIARMADYDAKEELWLEEYERENANWTAEVKGDKALAKLQRSELMALKEDHKALTRAYKKAKFFPVKAQGGLKLELKLPNMFTTSLSVDHNKQVLNVEVEVRRQKRDVLYCVLLANPGNPSTLRRPKPRRSPLA